ncbi:zinc finger cchc-type superfamily [Holotrichia oblita]|uniref:Zinc finger cchc-type superfamily n=1 Tax=Holotrichia oblita TaxID=644536 RepID=A0ACB9TUY3_HOLOL|nr:zinc finger cchc-type superfamily [Holotrichia oblita]
MTLEEVVDVISREISVSTDTLEVRALRPAFGNKHNVTVIMPAAATDKLIRMQKIKIDWMRCRIMKRQEDNRCWEHGHFKAECKGPNRERSCVKCAGEGHKASKCQNSSYCIHCKEEGHQSGSFKCPKRSNQNHRARTEIMELTLIEAILHTT